MSDPIMSYPLGDGTQPPVGPVEIAGPIVVEVWRITITLPAMQIPSALVERLFVLLMDRAAS